MRTGQVAAHAVIWLNEALFYLQPGDGEQVATELQALLADPRVRAGAGAGIDVARLPARPDRQITQELAGAPELRRYEQASPAAGAVLWTAMDAAVMDARAVALRHPVIATT